MYDARIGTCNWKYPHAVASTCPMYSDLQNIIMCKKGKVAKVAGKDLILRKG